MIIKRYAIFHQLAMKISHEVLERNNGCVFKFEDINPSAEFKNVLSKRDRLQLSWFFLRSVFITTKE